MDWDVVAYVVVTIVVVAAVLGVVYFAITRAPTTF